MNEKAERRAAERILKAKQRRIEKIEAEARKRFDEALSEGERQWKFFVDMVNNLPFMGRVKLALMVVRKKLD